MVPHLRKLLHRTKLLCSAGLHAYVLPTVLHLFVLRRLRAEAYQHLELQAVAILFFFAHSCVRGTCPVLLQHHQALQMLAVSALPSGGTVHCTITPTCLCRFCRCSLSVSLCVFFFTVKENNSGVPDLMKMVAARVES